MNYLVLSTSLEIPCRKGLNSFWFFVLFWKIPSIYFREVIRSRSGIEVEFELRNVI